MKFKFALTILAAATLSAVAFTHSRPAPPPPPASEQAQPASEQAVAPAAPFGGYVFTLLGGGTLIALGSIRRIIDAREIMSAALPAAGASAYTASLDIGTGPHVERTEFQLDIPATPALVDAKTVIGALQDSADNVTFADIAALGVITALGAGGVGAAAQTATFRLPPTANRYLRARFTVLAAGGNNTAVTGSLTPLN